MEVPPKRPGYSLPRLELFLPDIEAAPASVVQAGKVKKPVERKLKKVKPPEKPEEEKRVTKEGFKSLDKASVDLKKAPEKMTMTLTELLKLDKMSSEMNARKAKGIDTSDEDMDPSWEEIYQNEQKLTERFQKFLNQNSGTKIKKANDTSGEELLPKLKQVENLLTEEQRRALTLEAFGDSETDEEIREKVDQDEVEREKLMDKETLFNYRVEKRDKARWEMRPQKEEPKPVTLKSFGRGRGGRLPKMPAPSDQEIVFGRAEIKPKPKEMFKGSLLYKQIKEIDPSILRNLMVTPGHLVDLDPYKNYAKFDIREGNLFQKLCNNQRNSEAEDQVPINLENYRKLDKLDLGEQFSLFLKCQTMTPEETRIRWQLALDLFLVLRQKYPQLEMEVTGSFLLGLGDGQSALDIFGDFGNKLEDLDKVGKYLAGLEDPHKENRKMFLEVATGSSSSTLLLNHEKTGILVNLYFGRGINVKNSKLLCFDFDPRVKPFLMLVRYWADIHGLTCQSYRNQYPLSLLALVYLLDKLVPDEDQLPGSLEKSFKTVEPLPENFEQDKDIKANTVLKMMTEFCKLLGKWDTSRAVVCPLYGMLCKLMEDLMRIPKKKRNEGKLLVELEMELKKLGNVNLEDLCYVYKKMGIQDLPDLQCNANENAEDVKLKRFRLACEKTAERIGAGIKSLLELFKKLE